MKKFAHIENINISRDIDFIKFIFFFSKENTVAYLAYFIHVTNRQNENKVLLILWTIDFALHFLTFYYIGIYFI